MKVLKQPRAPKTYIFTCANTKCGAEFEAAEHEALRTVYDQRDGNAIVFRCTFCGKENWVGI